MNMRRNMSRLGIVDEYGRFEVGDKARLKEPTKWIEHDWLNITTKNAHSTFTVYRVDNIAGRDLKNYTGQKQSIYLKNDDPAYFPDISWADYHWELVVEIKDLNDLQDGYDVD